MDGVDGEFRASERDPGGGASACSFGGSYPDCDSQRRCDPYRDRYRRCSPRGRVFGVWLSLVAHKMKVPAPKADAFCGFLVNRSGSGFARTLEQFVELAGVDGIGCLARGLNKLLQLL